MNKEQLKDYYDQGKKHFWELNKENWLKDNPEILVKLDRKGKESLINEFQRFFDAGFGGGVLIESERVTPSRFRDGSGSGGTITSYGSTA